jgi:UDP-N-acetylmuramate--alanine ligase
MSALARYFKNIGKQVSGYDKTTALTKSLIDSGIAIHFEDSIDMIPKDYFIETP